MRPKCTPGRVAARVCPDLPAVIVLNVSRAFFHKRAILDLNKYVVNSLYIGDSRYIQTTIADIHYYTFFHENFGCCSTSKALSQWTIYIIENFFYLDNKNEIPGKNL